MLESRVRPLRISLPMTRMQAVTVFAGSDMRCSLSLSFRTLAEAAGGPSAARSCYRRYRMPNMGHEQPPRLHRRQRRLLAARRPHHQASRPGGLRGHAPGRPAGGRDARLHHAPRRSRASPPASSTSSATTTSSTTRRSPPRSATAAFPKSICTSINHVVCHGIPGDKRLQTGDIVNIDVTVILDGWYGDTSRMFYRRRRRREGAPAVRHHLRGDDARHRRRQAGRPRRRHRPRHPELRRGAALLRGARLLAAMGSAASSTTRPTSCITARPAPARC